MNGAVTAPGWPATDLEEYEALRRARLEHVVPVSEPLVLVSQAKRSGGSLLSQLFDGHRQCHAHPAEIEVGYPQTRNWPELDLEKPEDWYEQLHEARPAKDLRRGYRKSPRPEEADLFPFVFAPLLQQEIFAQCVAQADIRTQRDVLDAYFTSYFNAWLDNQNMHAGPKRVITGFAPQLVLESDSVARFFADYPDGTMISIVRRPHAWFVSLRDHDSTKKRSPENEKPEVAMELWVASARAALGARATYGDRFVLVTYEQLVGDTETAMGAIAERIGIDSLPILLIPTFNGRPIRANSSGRVDRHGVLSERAHSDRDSLGDDVAAQIDELAGDLYAQAEAASVVTR